MNIALLGSANSIHTQRWVNSLVDQGLGVHLFSIHPFSDKLSAKIDCHPLTWSAPWGYYLAARQLARALQQLKPDLLHAHYASGYGTLARLSGYRPMVLSVWGADVYDFPKISWLHRRLLRSNLLHADKVCSTSEVMADQTVAVCPSLDRPSVVSFGVDTQQFTPSAVKSEARSDDTIVIGTVKTLAPKYGIDVLIRGFAKLRTRLQQQKNPFAEKLKLRLVGEGPIRSELEQLADSLSLNRSCQFVGSVPHHQVPEELCKLDIYVAASRLDSESFGVAIIEASACEVPVVVADVGGLPEVVDDGVTGFVVPRENPTALADSLEQLVNKSKLRTDMGQRGRKRVQAHYEWQSDVERMISIYQEIAKVDVTSGRLAA